MKKKITRLITGFLMIISAIQTNAQIKPIVQPVSNITRISAVNLKLSKVNNTFSNSFNRSAQGRNDVNAYLMCYITTLIFPQYLAIVSGDASDAAIDRMHSGGVFFESEYKKQTAHLFSNPQYEFVTESHPAGYDPEAMVVSTTDAIYVIFRGTDRVATNAKKTIVSRFMYDWGEWLLSDFDTRLTAPVELTGKVHTGFWASLSFNNFKDKLVQVIKEKGGANKKVWISGHSLGSAHAQIFAMYLANKGIRAQGVYVYSAPHPGTQEFVDALDDLFPNQRLQRFDFGSDPVTMLAPYTLGFRRAGTRVFYKDIRSIQFAAPERSIAEATAIPSGLIGIGANLTGKNFCYHHPTWILRAAYTQLTTAEREKVPAPLPLPDATSPNGYSDGCDVLAINKGKNATAPGSLLELGAVKLAQGLKLLKFAAQVIMDNVTGIAITPGDYYIKSYASGGRLSLNETEGFENGSAMKLTTSTSKVKIQKFGTVGYTIRFGTRNVNGLFGTELKEYVLDSQAEDLFDDGSTTIQLWEKNSLPGLSANQRWLFIRLEDNKYLIKNIANGKLLDANNACLDSNECGVKTWNPVTDDQTQIWILEKA